MLNLCIRVTVWEYQVLLSSNRFNQTGYQKVGKGEIMPKINRNRKSRSKKIHLTEADSLLIDLEKVSMTGSSQASAANSLKMWYLQHKYWSVKQWCYAKSIVAKSKKTAKPSKPKKYNLYAITDGTYVKLGYSSNIPARIKAMQTGHPEPLTLSWKYYTGTTESEAKRLETKLHRFCRNHKVRGEWFNSDCMAQVERFKINEKVNIDSINDELDMQALSNMTY